jgi:hypothetical protein
MRANKLLFRHSLFSCAFLYYWKFIAFTGMMSAAASLGLILLWDIDAGLTQLDKYLYSKEDYIKVRVEFFW